MDRFLIHGGVPLHGTVRIGGAKNAALPLMAAAILTPKTVALHGVPQLNDVGTMLKVLAHLGVQHEVTEAGELRLQAETIGNPAAPYDLVKTMRASSMILGPLLARAGHARVSLPGGCAIGARPMDLHLKALQAMGAVIRLEEGYIIAEAERLHGAEIAFDCVTVTGTENVMMAAVLAEGRTVLRNAAWEPEVPALAGLLNAMGARIAGAGTSEITIDGVAELGGASQTVIADRIVAGTFLIAAAMTNGDVTLENFPAEYLATLIEKARDAGVLIETTDEGDRTRDEGRGTKDEKTVASVVPASEASGRPSERSEWSSLVVKGPSRLRAVDITTAPHPGFATDLQAQWMAAMTIADGTSVIAETIFENRFMHVAELRRMGASISVEGHTATVTGVPKLSGAPLTATDLRASASLVLAGIAAEGTTEIQRVYHIDRGYERIEEQLAALGARIERVKTVT